MSRASIAYAASLDATPQAELTTLASVYRFVLDCHAKKAACSGGPDDTVVRHKEEVSPVDQQPDRSSEIT